MTSTRAGVPQRVCPPQRGLAGDGVAARAPAFQAGSPESGHRTPGFSRHPHGPQPKERPTLATGRGHSSPRGRSRTAAHGSRATSFPDVPRFQGPRQRGTRFGVSLAGRRTQREDESLRGQNRRGGNVATTRPRKMSRRVCTPKVRVPEGQSGLIASDDKRRREPFSYKWLRNRLTRASPVGLAGTVGPLPSGGVGRRSRDLLRHTVPRGSSRALGRHRCCAHTAAGRRADEITSLNCQDSH